MADLFHNQVHPESCVRSSYISEEVLITSRVPQGTVLGTSLSLVFIYKEINNDTSLECCVIIIVILTECIFNLLMSKFLFFPFILKYSFFALSFFCNLF